MINIRIIFFLLAGTILFFLLLRFQGKLETTNSPLGIVSLEMAHNANTIRDINTSWEDEGMTKQAKANVWIDFFFIPFYAMLFYTLCGSISTRMQGFPAKLGVLLAFGSLVAGLFDMAENVLMLFSLAGHYNNFSAILTTIFSTAKFFFLFLALIYVFALGLRIILLRLIGKSYHVQV